MWPQQVFWEVLKASLLWGSEEAEALAGPHLGASCAPVEVSRGASDLQFPRRQPED